MSELTHMLRKIASRVEGYRLSTVHDMQHITRSRIRFSLNKLVSSSRILKEIASLAVGIATH